jgi:MFS family permease
MVRSMSKSYMEIRMTDNDEPTLFSPMELEQEQPRRRDWKRVYSIGLYSVTTILLYADQNLLAPNLSQVATEFGFSDDERDRKLGGDISLAFFLLGAPASLIIGCWGDHSNRMVLTGWTIGLGEGACFATYFSQTYQHLYICRALTGLSLGGALPLMYSVLGDWFGADDRHLVTAVVGMGTGLGTALGQGIAGLMGPRFGWRSPFLVVSIPALICAILLAFTVQDPPRGEMEKAVLERIHDRSSRRNAAMIHESLSPGDLSVNQLSTHEETEGPKVKRTLLCRQDWRENWMTFLDLLSTKTFILSLLQGAPGCLPWGIVNTFLNDFLSEDRGMTVEGATMTVLLFGLGNFLGLLIGGVCGRSLYRCNPRYPPLFAGSMAMLGCLPFWILLNNINAHSGFFRIGVVSVLAGAGSGATGPIVKATLQNITLPKARGQAFALFNTFDDFGRGLGPLFVSLLIVDLGGRTPAFNIGVLGWVMCGFFNLCMFFFVVNDELHVQVTLATELVQSENVERRIL